QALDTLLRSAAGYLAAPRAVYAANLSRYDRVVVMPTSSAPRATAAATQPGFPQPQYQQPQPPQFAQPAVVDDEPAEQERPTPNPAMPGAAQNPRGPMFNAFPQPQIVNPQTGAPVTVMPGQQPTVQQMPVQQPVYGSTPTAPVGGGVAVPGMMVPVPQPATGSPSQAKAPPNGGIRRPGGPNQNDRNER